MGGRAEQSEVNKDQTCLDGRMWSSSNGRDKRYKGIDEIWVYESLGSFGHLLQVDDLLGGPRYGRTGFTNSESNRSQRLCLSQTGLSRFMAAVPYVRNPWSSRPCDLLGATNLGHN